MANPKKLAECALSFTPWVSLDFEQALLLEIRGSLNLFGGAEALTRYFRSSLRPVATAVPLRQFQSPLRFQAMLELPTETARLAWFLPEQNAAVTQIYLILQYRDQPPT